MMSSKALRKRVERELGRPLTPKQWALVLQTTYHDDVADDEAVDVELEDVYLYVDKAREIFAVFGDLQFEDDIQPRMLEPQEQLPSNNAQPPRILADRLTAISTLLAQYADDEPDVKWFRQTVLKGSMLDHEDLEAWINQQAEEDGPP